MHASIVSFHRLTTCTVRMRNDDVVSTLPYSLPPLATKLSSCSTLCCCVKLPPFTNPTLTTFVLTPFSFYIFLLFISPPIFSFSHSHCLILFYSWEWGREGNKLSIQLLLNVASPTWIKHMTDVVFMRHDSPHLTNRLCEVELSPKPK